jgi:DNA anti-recombination protein RmuC
MLKQLFQNYKFLLGVNFSAESAGNSEGELKEDAQKLSLDLTKRFLKEMGDNIDGSSLQAVKGINDNFEEASQYFQKISKNDRNTLEKMIETEYAESLCDGITIKDADSLKVFKRLLERIHPEFDAEFLALDKLATAVGKMKSVAGDKILLTYEDGAVTLYTSVKNEINGLVDHQDKKVVSYSSA